MIAINKIHNVNVLDVQGELSRHNVSDLDRTLSSLSERAQFNIVLDFEKLRHLDYRLVQHIADRIIEFQCDGGDLKVAGASNYVRHILQAMGLEEEVYTSVQDALMSFMQEAPLDALQ